MIPQHARTIALAVLAASACAPLPSEPPEVVVTVAGRASPPNTTSTRSTDRASCRLRSQEWNGLESGTLDLRFGPGTPPFATATSGSLEVRIERTSKVHVHATASDDGLRVEGAVHPEDLALFPSRVITLAGVVIPGSTRILRLGRATKGLTVRYQVDEDVHLVHAVACADISLHPVAFNPIDGLVDEDLHEAVAIEVDALGVAESRTAAPVAHFSTEDEPETYVVERRGDRARIVWPRVGDVVTGWVDTTDLGDVLTHRIGRPWETGGLGLMGIGPRTSTVCDHDLVLHARVDAQQRQVGRVAAGTRLDLHDQRGGFTEISAPFTAISSAEDAAFLVESAALAGCEER